VQEHVTPDHVSSSISYSGRLAISMAEGFDCS
jgi:hypothetical protein